MTHSLPHPVVSVGAAFRPGGYAALIRSVTRCLSLVGVNALIYDQTQHRQLDGLDSVDQARDAETFSADIGDVRLVFVQDVDPDDFLGAGAAETGKKTVAVIDMAPERDDQDTLDMLRRFDAVWGVSDWVVDALRASGIDAAWMGRSFEPCERAFVPRRQFRLPGAARVVVIPFDADEFINPAAEGVYAAYVSDLLDNDPLDQLRIAVIAPGSESELPEFPDDPRISFHQLAGQDYLADSLLNTADCVVSFEATLRIARSLGRAAWLGRPVLSMRLSADRDLPGGPDGGLDGGPDGGAQGTAPLDALLGGENTDPQALARTLADRTRALWQADDAGNGRAMQAQSDLMARFSSRALGTRLLALIEELST